MPRYAMCLGCGAAIRGTTDGYCDTCIREGERQRERELG